jgi:ABC-type multidrug transport system permease subunit
METLTQISAFFMGSLFPHWPGISFIVFITILAQTLKSRVLTVEIARKNRVVFWSRRIYPILLLLLGIIPGVLWPGEVYPSIDGTFEKIMYFMGCSGVSILGFNIFKQWVKKKYDIDVEVPSDEVDSTKNKG